MAPTGPQRPLPVRLLMGFAGGRVGEGFVALPAGEGLLTGVDADVPLEVPGVGELLPAVLEAERDAQASRNTGDTEGQEPRWGRGHAHLALVRDGAVGFRLGPVAVSA